ncbi:hypothetical protein IFR05_014722, partial [Cadophora sp. M221]
MIIRYIRITHIPGPALASWTKLWRLQDVATGQNHKTIINLHRKYGKLVRTAPNVVDVSDPAMIPVIYNIKGNFKKTAFYPIATLIWQKKAQSNLFSEIDEGIHREQKMKTANAFSMTNLLELEPAIDSCSTLFMEKLQEFAKAGKSVDLGSWLQYYAFDVIGEITFGQKLGFMEKGTDVDGTMKAIEIMTTYNTLVGQIPLAHKFLLGIPGLAYIFPQIETMNTILNFTLKAINSSSHSSQEPNKDQQVQDPKIRKDMLWRWTSLPPTHPLKMTKRDLIAHCSSNVFAGSDTTAIALRAAIYYLCKNPSTMSRLVSELNSADLETHLSTPTPPSYKQLSHIPYLNAVIKETLRIHPSIGLLLERHVPKGGATISGVFIPENTIVGINAWALHYDESIFPDPEEFIPERWIDSSVERLSEMERSFLPFGAGSRTCTGKN